MPTGKGMCFNSILIPSYLHSFEEGKKSRRKAEEKAELSAAGYAVEQITFNILQAHALSRMNELRAPVRGLDR
jgi:hypothetical protein